MLRTIFTLTLTWIFLCAPMAHAQPSMLEHMQKLDASLVSVKTVYTKIISTPKGKKQISYTRQGTGIIIDPKGLILTNTHIIKNAPKINIITHDGHLYFAEVLFVSTEYDFSIIKIPPKKPLTAIKFADSATTKIGEPIMAIGSSDFNNKSILAGNITGLIQSNSNGTIEFLETNLNLYQGDSGGPIFNSQGKLLGMIMGKHQSKQRSSLCIASDRMHEEYLRIPINKSQ